MIERPHRLASVRELFRSHPCVAILGPRQCGKTTLARMLGLGEASRHFFDLESPLDARKLDAPRRTLGALEGLIVLDEVQRKPQLFEVLRVLVDRPEAGMRSLLLGSASPSLFKGVSESLAGRVGFVDLSGFDLREGGAELDLMLTVRGRRYGFELKTADAPGPTRSMRIALADLALEHLWVVYPGSEAYELDDRLSVIPLQDVPRLPARLGACMA